MTSAEQTGRRHTPFRQATRFLRSALAASRAMKSSNSKMTRHVPILILARVKFLPQLSSALYFLPSMTARAWTRRFTPPVAVARL